VFVVMDPAGSLPTMPNAMSAASVIGFYAFAVVLPFGFVLMCNDRYISQRRHAEEALSAAALVDTLTQLPNRARVTTRLADRARLARQEARLYAVLCIDINNFKYALSRAVAPTSSRSRRCREWTSCQGANRSA